MAQDPETGSIKIGELDGLLGYHLRRVTAHFSADYAQRLASTGLRQTLIGVMFVIDANPGINQGNVASALGIQRANMVALVNELVELGYIDRQTAAEDRRALSLTLTERGGERLDEASALIREHERAMLTELSRAERTTLRELLQRISPAAD